MQRDTSPARPLSQRIVLANPMRYHIIALAKAVLLTSLALSVCLSHTSKGQNFVPFVIPDTIDPHHAIWQRHVNPIRVDSDHLVAQHGQFQGTDGPVRIWGVNLSFGANFPTHEDAARIAARLAAAGVNSVRCHHMDTSRWPRGIWNAEDGKTVEPEALDRLDYFLNELAKCGIYANLNLHVGRAHSRYLGLPEANREYDKISGIFTPELIAAQKQFARELLTHVNPYRKTRYADDPAVAFVEITNEDSFFMWSSEETLRTLPDYYAGILRGQFNQWLRHRYHSSDRSLQASWSRGTEPLGENLLKNGNFDQWDQQTGFPPNWDLERHAGCQASVTRTWKDGRSAVAVKIARADETQWHLQLTQGRIPLEQGRYYTVTFEARSDGQRQIDCSVGQAHDPWRNLGLSRAASLTPQWQRFSFGFVATDGDTNARVSFVLGGNDAPVYLANVQVCPGGQVALVEGESLAQGTVALFAYNESQPRIVDRMMFLAETEKTYFDGMRAYIRNELNCQALVTGTIVFGPLGLYAQSDMDWIDAHAYWQHPRFPGQPWDQGNWIVEQKPMTDSIEEATLFRLAAERMAGKPFTVSEYNHPAPMDSQAECVPMLASFGAAQNWNGLWFYTYSHSGSDWDREHLSGFFDIDTNPAKWAFMRAGATIFRDDGIRPLTLEAKTMGSWHHLDQLAQLHLQHDTNMFGLLTQVGDTTRSSMLQRAIVPSYGAEPAPAHGHSDGRAIQWSLDASGRGFYQVQGPQAQVYTGHSTRFSQATEGAVLITSPEFVAMTVTSLDTQSHLSPSDHQTLLVTACGRCENTGMQFSRDRRTVGRDWGQGPVRIETVEGQLTLPEGRWSCQALAPDGSPRQDVPIAYKGGRGVLEMSSEYETLWYLLKRQ